MLYAFYHSQCCTVCILHLSSTAPPSFILSRKPHARNPCKVSAFQHLLKTRVRIALTPPQPERPVTAPAAHRWRVRGTRTQRKRQLGRREHRACV
ncbi:hypothetical protein PENSPDRAFT_442474 [Peniophora sp. CONT]|nr:hypothetical protein PENSPDRAFT_442474 [Peniophora sp. CONT]